MPPGADPLLDLLTRFIEAHGVFVYGTLMPGEERWGLVADLVHDDGPAMVAGTLLDTGYGYPAAIFDDGAAIRVDGATTPAAAPPDAVIHGHHLRAQDGRAEEIAHLLLAIEGDLYEPRLVARTDGAAAAAFAWLGSTDAMAPLRDGRWSARS